MKISRRIFLKGSATTLFLAGFNFPVLANADKKKNAITKHISFCNELF